MVVGLYPGCFKVKPLGVGHSTRGHQQVGAADLALFKWSLDGQLDFTIPGSLYPERRGFQQDLNVVFPVERLKELAAEGAIGSVADYHYSFMGSTEPDDMEPLVREIAGYLKEDCVDAVLLAPV